MSEYTPTTAEVRQATEEWVWSRRMFRDELSPGDGREFDRWLAQHDAEVKAEALTDAAYTVGANNVNTPGHRSGAEWLRGRANSIIADAATASTTKES